MAPFLLFLTYFFFLTHKINLITADLGRHLSNGKFLFQNPAVLFSNFYSYTNPNFPVINHHWGSGLIFWSILKLGGFPLLSLFYIFLSLITFLIFFFIAKKASFSSLVVLISLPLIPLLAERTEIRPEIFSYFLSGVFLLLLNSQKYLWLIPILQIFWVNLHIYFFLGPLLVLVFFLNKKSPTLFYLLGGTLLSCLINPFGLQGALAPLKIFENYGYRLIENQPVWFIEKLIRNPNFSIFKINFLLLILSFFFYFKKNKKISFINLSLAVFFSLLGWRAIRNFTLFALFALPIMAENYGSLFSPKPTLTRSLNLATSLILILALPLLISGRLPSLFPYWHEFGLGLEKNNSKAAEFLKKENIQGPIFNDYDIGGYLIFHLFPQHRVFVDNRPEAYPKEFFEKIYIPAQENEEEWKKLENKYQFNVIVFNRLDATPWGQKFIISRFYDPTWALVFIDQQVVIFLKRNQKNEKIIQTYEIPKETMIITNN